jgi:hypothetical protein
MNNNMQTPTSNNMQTTTNNNMQTTTNNNMQTTTNNNMQTTTNNNMRTPTGWSFPRLRDISKSCKHKAMGVLGIRNGFQKLVIQHLLTALVRQRTG